MEVYSSLKIIVLVAVAAGFVVNAQAKCGDCLTNGVACINETSFQLCIGGEPSQSQTITCPDGEVCTGLKIICSPADQVDPACDDAKGCGVCGVNAFTCISKTKFALCSGGATTGVQGKCPDGTLCNAGSSTADVCVDKCLGTASCNVDDPVQ